ncbi:MAG: hypothetical protein ACYS47_08035, partial [Planctomycetota bacterium]
MNSKSDPPPPGTPAQGLPPSPPQEGEGYGGLCRRTSNSKPHRNPVKGFLYALAGVALVSTNFVTAKYAVSKG